MFNRPNISDWLNRTNYTAEERRIVCAQIMSEAQYWDSTQYLRMMHDSTKRPWVGLTDEEIDRYFDEQWGGYSSYHDCFKEVMRWQEAKLKEKNT